MRPIFEQQTILWKITENVRRTDIPRIDIFIQSERPILPLLQYHYVIIFVPSENSVRNESTQRVRGRILIYKYLIGLKNADRMQAIHLNGKYK